MMDCLHWAAIPSCLQGNDLEQVQEFELPNCICLVTPVACEKSAQGDTSVRDNYAWHVTSDLSLIAGSEELGDYCSSSPGLSQSWPPTLPYLLLPSPNPSQTGFLVFFTGALNGLPSLGSSSILHCAGFTHTCLKSQSFPLGPKNFSH